MTEMTLKKRPKNLDLATINLPLPGKVSILHRVSGVGLFLCLPVLLCLFQASVSSADAFLGFQTALAHPLLKFLLMGLVWAYLHHFCAGIRFLLLDVHVGLDLPVARKSSALVLLVSLTLTVVLWGVLIW